MVHYTVSDIKQFFYCPRIIYYTYCLPVEKKITHKMERGAEEHKIISVLETRRTLKRYQLNDGERRFGVNLFSETLGLSGILDALVISPAGYFPVEFKYTSKGVTLNHKCQIAAYALLVEEQFQTNVSQGFLFSVPDEKINTVTISAPLRAKIQGALESIREIIQKELLPLPPKNKGKCIDCEYRNYCQDVI